MLSLVAREVNFQQNPHNTSHHIFSCHHTTLEVSFGIRGRKCKRNV